MKVVVQRVKKASVKINGQIKGEISAGLLVFVAFKEDDGIEQIKWFANKLANLRIFNDEEGKMNKSALDVNGEMLIISNFTLYGDVQRGFRPSFTDSAPANIAEPLYDEFVKYLKENYPLKIEDGVFGAMMDIELINDGPVTIIIEK